MLQSLPLRANQKPSAPADDHLWIRLRGFFDHADKFVRPVQMSRPATLDDDQTSEFGANQPIFEVDADERTAHFECGYPNLSRPLRR
jgi:hypothetical protein